jgi:hypothetical protein
VGRERGREERRSNMVDVVGLGKDGWLIRGSRRVRGAKTSLNHGPSIDRGGSRGNIRK